MIIGISGKKQHGKDLVAQIVQYLMYCQYYPEQNLKFEDRFPLPYIPDQFQIKRFADKLKDMVCMLIGCTRERLEDNDFKEMPLGEEWIRYAYADGHNDHYRNGEWSKSMNSVFCNKEKYEEEYRINWQTAYKSELTPRLLLQLLGTNCGRNIIHQNIWVNATMADYKASADLDVSKPPQRVKGGFAYGATNIQHPNWIIPDVRFPNELEAVEKKGGIVYRIERPGIDNNDSHESETALDGHDFANRLIINDGSIEGLIIVIKGFLQRDKILING